MVTFILYCLTSVLVGAGCAVIKTEIAIGYLAASISFSGAIGFFILSLIHADSELVSLVLLGLYGIVSLYLFIIVHTQSVKNTYVLKRRQLASAVRCSYTNLGCFVTGTISLSCYFYL